MNPQTLRIDIAGSITATTATITLARPDIRNAFNETAIAELTAIFEKMGSDSDFSEVRAVILAAQGAAFCAGADLDWMRRMAAYTPEQNRADALKLAQMLRAIDECPKPVIARVHGDAYGGGMGLVAACDMAFAADSASFCLSEVRLGLIPATIAPYVIKAMGEHAARRYVLTAEKFDAAEALRIGFVHGVAPANALDEKIDQVIAALLQTSSHAVEEAKRLVRDVAGRTIDEALLTDTAQRIADARASDDGKEGVCAFLEKRKPRWASSHNKQSKNSGTTNSE